MRTKPISSNRQFPAPFGCAGAGPWSLSCVVRVTAQRWRPQMGATMVPNRMGASGYVRVQVGAGTVPVRPWRWENRRWNTNTQCVKIAARRDSFKSKFNRICIKTEVAFLALESTLSVMFKGWRQGCQSASVFQVKLTRKIPAAIFPIHHFL